MSNPTKPFFAPQLYIPSGTVNIDFYTKGLGAIELRRFSNDDGTIHVSELSIEGTVFHLHEESVRQNAFGPGKYNGTTIMIGLFVEDVHAYMNRAMEAGATLITPVEDYDYGYRQGEIKDPFGHLWMFEKRI